MIRPARDSDAAAIADVWNPIIRNTAVTFTSIEKTEGDVNAVLAARAAAGQPFLVAEEVGVVAGFATFFQFRTGPGYARAMEHSVNLAPLARGRGLGRALMMALEQAARAQGIHALIGAVSGENADSIRFHEKLGYTEVGRLREVGWKFDRFHDLVFMQKLL